MLPFYRSPFYFLKHYSGILFDKLHYSRQSVFCWRQFWRFPFFYTFIVVHSALHRAHFHVSSSSHFKVLRLNEAIEPLSRVHLALYERPPNSCSCIRCRVRPWVLLILFRGAPTVSTQFKRTDLRSSTCNFMDLVLFCSNPSLWGLFQKRIV